jgi:hypothetical protein
VKKSTKKFLETYFTTRVAFALMVPIALALGIAFGWDAVLSRREKTPTEPPPPPPPLGVGA